MAQRKIRKIKKENEEEKIKDYEYMGKRVEVN